MLQHNPHINQNMTLMVRQLESNEVGLPLEIYCFTNTTAWTEYEGIQSDIFDHILAKQWKDNWIGKFGSKKMESFWVPMKLP